MQSFLYFVKKYRYLVIVLCLVVAYFLMVAVLYIIDSHTYKGGTTYSGILVENLTTDQAQDKIQKQFATTPVTLSSEGTTLQTNAENLGAEVDNSVLEQQLHRQRLQYAFLPFMYTKQYRLPITANQDRLLTTARSIELPENKKPPVDASVDYIDNTLLFAPESSGDGVDTTVVFDELQKQLQNGAKEIAITAKLVNVQPRITKESLEKRTNDITAILSNKYSITDGNKTYILTPKEVANSLFINESNQLQPTYAAAAHIVSNASQQFSYAPVTELLYSYTSGKQNKVFQNGVKGQTVTNEPELIDQLQNAVLSAQETVLTATTTESTFATKTFVIDDANKKVYTYTTDTLGTTSSIAYFREKAAETLLSEKGWTRAGITFEEVQNNPDFHLVLAEGAEMSRRYSPDCDAYYSCRVGDYVIINDSRWQSATPVWPKDIRAYQNLVVNHETGHWLGLGHYFCSTAGAPAPVMQQQSIEIRNCTFNEWPLEYEIQKL